MEYKPDNNNLKSRFPDNQGQSKKSDGVWTPEGARGTSNQYFAVAPEKDPFIRRFKLRLRSAKSYSIPYALLPIIELDANKTLKILTHDLCIMIKGRNLEGLEKALNEERVVWIRESASGKDTGDEDVFISEISIGCDFIV